MNTPQTDILPATWTPGLLLVITALAVGVIVGAVVGAWLRATDHTCVICGHALVHECGNICEPCLDGLNPDLPPLPADVSARIGARVQDEVHRTRQDLR